MIYQLHDMMDLGFLGVGNDYETTSQYGGTGHAGDIGTMPQYPESLRPQCGPTTSDDTDPTHYWMLRADEARGNKTLWFNNSVDGPCAQTFLVCAAYSDGTPNTTDCW